MAGAVTIPGLQRMKREGRKIVAITAYDYAFARLFAQAGADILLVGDSLGMVVQGRESTLGVTVDEMIYHTRAVCRGAVDALVVCDLPFGSFQESREQAMACSARVMKESGCQAVKLEGGETMAETIAFLTQRGVPVVAHVGLTPQSVHQFGGYKVQGRGEAAARVMADALAVAQAGAGLLILEGIPATLAETVTNRIEIPTIGIGAGAACDGQVLVSYDLLGLFEELQPRFVKRYLEGGTLVREAVARFSAEVREGVFPGPEHSFQG